MATDWTQESRNQRGKLTAAFGKQDASAQFSRSGNAYPHTPVSVAVDIYDWWVVTAVGPFAAEMLRDNIALATFEAELASVLAKPAMPVDILERIAALSPNVQAAARAVAKGGLAMGVSLVASAHSPGTHSSGVRILAPAECAGFWDGVFEIASALSGLSAGVSDSELWGAAWEGVTDAWSFVAKQATAAGEFAVSIPGKIAVGAARVAAKAVKAVADETGITGLVIAGSVVVATILLT